MLLFLFISPIVSNAGGFQTVQVGSSEQIKFCIRRDIATGGVNGQIEVCKERWWFAEKQLARVINVLDTFEIKKKL